MAKRVKTTYPGVYYLEGQRNTGPGTEKIYYIVFKKNGKVREEKAGRQYLDKMTPAKAALYRAERMTGERPSRKEVRAQEEAEGKKKIWTVQNLWEEYKSSRPDRKDPGADKSRFNKYLKPAFGKKQPHEISPFEVDRLRVKMLKTKKPQTVKNTLALLRRIINDGVNKRLCRPLTFKIEMPKRINNTVTEDLTSEQLGDLLKAIEEDSHPQAGNIMKLALFTGMRRGEMFKLQWEDLDFERGFIRIRDPKGGVDQKIPMNEQARELLGSIEKTEGTPFVFPGRGGVQRVDITKALAKIMEKAKLPKGFRPLHGLRHVYASMLASSGRVDMFTLQKLLTHKDPKMTQRYAHLRDEALRAASEVAGGLISEALKKREHRREKRAG